MVRGRPFTRSLPRLVRGGVAARPLWLATVEKIPPHFSPVVETRPPRLWYPEDRLRAKYLAAHPELRRIPVDLKAHSKADAHPADRFVALQLRAMRDKGLSEDDAYAEAERSFAEGRQFAAEKDATIQRTLLDNQSQLSGPERLFHASLVDSEMDQRLMESMSDDEVEEAEETKDTEKQAQPRGTREEK